MLSLVGAGLSNRELAARLYISEATVKTHVGAIFAKLAAPAPKSRKRKGMPKARAAKMTPEERSESARKAANARWAKKRQEEESSETRT